MSFVTPKKNAEYIFYIGLPDQADTKLFKANPTIAAGDFKVSTDGGALGNPATIPAVTPASGKMVKVTLSASEMNGDNVTLVASDAAGAEWCDVIMNIQTSVAQIDDLATSTALATAQTDLDTITGTDGATLATAQGNYAPAKASDILTTALTEAYAADGAAPTLSELLFLVQQSIHEFAISGVTRTVKKLDGTTTAATFTFDDASSPTSTTRLS